VALGFECPLFRPVRDDPARLTASRDGERDRAWSVRAGAQALVTGLAQAIWVLRAIRRPRVRPFMDWRMFSEARRGLFLWEAFVTSRAKGKNHAADAAIAVRAFARCLPHVGRAKIGRAHV